MKRVGLYLMIAGLVFVYSGCSSIMALKQPSKKNLQVLAAGTSRDNVITYLGPPVTTDSSAGQRVEIYQFTQGYSGGVKAARAAWHITADLLTLFIWELIGMPAELIANGEKMSVKITYDQDDRIQDFVYLQQPAN